MEEYWVVGNSRIDEQTTKVINEFLSSKKAAPKSEKTLKKYRYLVENFFVHCGKPLRDLTPDDVYNWLSNKYGDKKEASLALAVSALSSFFKYCRAAQYLDRALIKKKWRPRKSKPLPKYLGKDEQALVKLAAEEIPLHDRAIYDLLLSSGCRRAEVAALNINDIDLDERTATVVGKGSKIRQVHFSETCAILLARYLETHLGGQALFLNRFGARLSCKAIYRLATKLGKTAGLSRHFTPHCTRHTFATNYLAKGAGLDFVSRELGHADQHNQDLRQSTQ